MEILTVVLYIIVTVVLIIIVLMLSFLLIPIRYTFDGGYRNIFRLSFITHFSPLLAIRGNWDSKSEESLQVRVTVFGVSFAIPEKSGKKDKKKLTKTEKRQSKNLPIFAVLRCLERDFMGSVKVLLVDLLGMLRPDKVEIKGKLGFAEPHLNGWLVAITSMLEQWADIQLNIEPVWQEEHYEVAVKVEGRVVLCAMIFRMARFILTRRTLKFLNQLRKEKKASFAA